MNPCALRGGEGERLDGHQHEERLEAHLCVCVASDCGTTDPGGSHDYGNEPPSDCSLGRAAALGLSVAQLGQLEGQARSLRAGTPGAHSHACSRISRRLP